ncbi:MAG: hypothetical protein C0597_09085 [Marinilabiliales bacterium]|nr:MAG: hypothetical protein C0597_09085 [Marinilabiliales bacterium]
MDRTDNFVLRDYQSQDFKKLSILWEETNMGNSRRGDNDQIIKQSIKLGGKLIVLIDTKHNELIGSSWITFDGRRFHLHHIAVKPSYQDQGFGKLLTIESVKFAKKKGYQIKLEVHQSNQKALEIYKKIGFQYLGDYDLYIIRNYDTIDF